MFVANPGSRDGKVVFALVFSICALSAFWGSVSHSSMAATKSSTIDGRLTFSELGSGGASLWTIIDVYSRGTEEYTKIGNNAKYSKRNVYAYGKSITASGHITFKVVPISHYDPNNNLLHTFAGRDMSEDEYWNSLKAQYKVNMMINKYLEGEYEKMADKENVPKESEDYSEKMASWRKSLTDRFLFCYKS